MKVVLLILLFFFSSSKNLVSFLGDQQITYDTSQSVKDSGSANFDDSINQRTLIDQMGFGWNLGNTFDAFDSKFGQNQGLNSETCWGNPATTDAMIDALIKKGFKTIRVPVTWHNHLVDKKYTIDPQWMKRVKEVVDMCLKKGLWVILNTHHDNANNDQVSYGLGYYPKKNSQAESEKFLANVWTQICEAFNKGYNQKLIFEGLNEPRLMGNQYEWWYSPGNPDCEEGNQVLNSFNKLIHSVIRKSGGNNAKRFIMFTSQAAAYSYVTGGNFELPDDSRYNSGSKKILVSVHMYSPYDFAMDPKSGVTTCNDRCKSELDGYFKTLHDKFVSQGYGVVIGEMGCVNRNNIAQRIEWAKYYVENSRKNGLACIVWDNGNWGDGSNPEETFGLFHRNQGTFEPDDLVRAYMQAAKTALG